MFNQLRKLANIYFVLVTLLSLIPNSPKSAGSSVLTLSISLIFLVIKDGGEDKQRRINDSKDNTHLANVYDYPSMGFVSKRKQDIRCGNIVTVFNNEELPADLVIINAHSGQAFFETVILDGEPILN